MCAADLEYIPAKSRPTSLAGACDVKDAGMMSCRVRCDEKNGICQVQGRCRIAPLVGDDGNPLTLGCDTQHCPDEIVAEGTIEPARAQDYVPGVDAGNGAFASELGI